MNFFAGVRLMVRPTTSSATSSIRLNRTHDLPMSSFLPVFAQASRNRRCSASEL